MTPAGARCSTPTNPGNLGVAGPPAGAVWSGDFEAWRRVAAFTLSKLRDGRRFWSPDPRPFRWSGHRADWRKPPGTQVNPAIVPTATARIPPDRTAVPRSGALVENGEDCPVTRIYPRN